MNKWNLDSVVTFMSVYLLRSDGYDMITARGGGRKVGCIDRWIGSVVCRITSNVRFLIVATETKLEDAYSTRVE